MYHSSLYTPRLLLRTTHPAPQRPVYSDLPVPPGGRKVPATPERPTYAATLLRDRESSRLSLRGTAWSRAHRSPPAPRVRLLGLHPLAPRTPHAGLLSDSPEDESERVTKLSPSGEPSWRAVLSCTRASRQVRRTEGMARRMGGSQQGSMVGWQPARKEALARRQGTILGIQV